MKKNLPPALKAASRLLALSVVTLGLHSAPAEAQTKQTFSTSGSYLVPAGVTNLVVKAWGAGGASGETETAQRAAGGSGGYVTGVLTVVPGETLNVVIGSPGSSTAGGASTVGAGGNGEPAPLGNNSPAAGGGGGATGVLRTGTPLVIAGGGGGGSSTQAVTPNNGGPGGGSSGIVGGGGAFGGGGGTQAAPGAGGISSNNNGLPGVGSVGGAGSTGNGQNAPGGGGGGGYFGGGGGARGNSGGNAGAGGGGSSFSGGMADVSNLAGTGAVPAANTDPDYLAGKAVGGTTGAGGPGLVVIIIPPSISNQSVTSIDFFSATLNADINPQGDSTTAYFEWGTSPTLAGATSTASTGLGSGTSNVPHTANLSGLAAHTTYYYRAVATNSGATVRGTIQSFTTLNNLPTVTRLNATVSVDEGSLTANSGTFGDADGDTVTVTASLGTITQGAGTWSWSYTPPDGSVSPTVTITANDGFTGIATTTFTLNVANVAPSIALTGNATVNEGSSYTLNLGTITEPGTDTISGYSIDWGDGSPATSGAGLPPATASHTYVDGAPGGTPRSIVVSLTDEDGTHTAGTKGITVNNVAPTANPQTYTVAEDSGLGTITLVASDPGVLDTISYGLDTGLANPAAGTLGIVSGNTISFTPAADFNGSTTFTFNASADSDTSNTATVTIVVTPVNDAPTGTDDPVASSAEEAARSFSIATLVSNDSKGPADESGQTLTITSIGTVSGGMAVINGANIDFTPDVDFNGPAFITYTVRDDGQTNGVDDFKTSTAKVLFTITPVNDAPVPVNDPLSAINEDSGTRLIPLATLHGNDSTGPGDENLQTLTITSLSAVVGGTAVINGANVEFTPTLNYFGPASFTYTVQDNGQSGSPPR
jgi:hypothetical protein